MRQPQLLERGPELTALGSYWTEALAGRGRLVFVGGEAGAGKTSIAYEFGRRVAGRARFLAGVCDPGATPRPLGPLVDVAGPLGVVEELDAPDVSHASLFPRVRAALGRSPTVLLLEDVHWADQATLDLVRYLARRLDGLPVVVLATFRDDEVMATHPLAGLMGDLATAAAVTRIQLPLLTVAAVAELAAVTDRRIDVEALHRSTDGRRVPRSAAGRRRASVFRRCVGCEALHRPGRRRRCRPRGLRRRCRRHVDRTQPCLDSAAPGDHQHRPRTQDDAAA